VFLLASAAPVCHSERSEESLFRGRVRIDLDYSKGYLALQGWNETGGGVIKRKWNPQITQISVIKRRNCLPRRRVTSKPFARCTCDSTKCAARGSFLNLRNLRNLWILVFFQMTSLPRNERTSGRVAAYYRLGANRTKLLDLFCTGRNCNKWSPGGKTAHLRT